jgi:hypothetical protein
VVYDRGGEPDRAVLALITDDGRRAWATVTDGDDMRSLVEEEGCGRRATTAADGNATF